MKILLFYPNFYGMNTLPPAIGGFTATLKERGHNVKLFDTTSYEGLFGAIDTDKQKSNNLNARPYDDSILKHNARHTSAESDFLAVINDFKPDLIALSCTEDTYPAGIRLLSLLGTDRPKVVAGGVFPTFAPDLALKYSEGKVDFILRGEGDYSLPEFCDRIDQGKDFTDLGGLYMIKDNRLINNKLMPPTDVNSLPLPDYSQFEDSRFYRPMHGKLRRMLPITTSRGCPYTCGYCNSPSQKEIYLQEGFKFLRKRTIPAIYRELKHCLDNYKADSFYFWADTFLVWNDREFDEFCEMYSEFKLPFWIQTRPETVTADRFKRLKAIGLLRVAFGIEHGNEDFRSRVLRRNVKNSMILENLKIVTDMGIPISVNNIIGFPTEERKLAFDTVELNRNIESDGINAYAYTPFHGSYLRKISEDLGFVEKGTLARCINNPTMIDMPQFTKEQIQGLIRCFVLYVKMPKDRWPEIEKAEPLTFEGDRIWGELKAECAAKYMKFGS